MNTTRFSPAAGAASALFASRYRASEPSPVCEPSFVIRPVSDVASSGHVGTLVRRGLRL